MNEWRTVQIFSGTLLKEQWKWEAKISSYVVKLEPMNPSSYFNLCIYKNTRIQDHSLSHMNATALYSLEERQRNRRERERECVMLTRAMEDWSSMVWLIGWARSGRGSREAAQPQSWAARVLQTREGAESGMAGSLVVELIWCWTAPGRRSRQGHWINRCWRCVMAIRNPRDELLFLGPQ
jgi:hypothetical protein